MTTTKPERLGKLHFTNFSVKKVTRSKFKSCFWTTEVGMFSVGGHREGPHAQNEAGIHPTDERLCRPSRS